jgi:hypothetical protein
MVEFDGPHSWIVWESQADPKKEFRISLEQFLIAAKTTSDEVSFRKVLYSMGAFLLKEKVKGASA